MKSGKGRVFIEKGKLAGTRALAATNSDHKNMG